MKYRILFFCMLMAALWSCKEKETPEQPRLFKPTDFSVSTYYDGFQASWKKSLGAEGYQVDVAKESDFSKVDTIVTTAADELKITIGGLEENKKYYLRLRALKADTALCSKYLYAEGITAAAYSIFFPVNQDSLSFSTALLEWRSSVNADRIVVSSEEAETQTVELIPQQLKARRIRIENLTAGNKYRAEMFEGTNSHGYTSFVMPSLPENLIRLNPSTADDFVAQIAAAPDGASILFEAGVYDYSAMEIVIDKSLTLMGEPGLKKPIIYFKSLLLGGKQTAASCDIGSFTITHLEVSGYQFAGNIEQHDLEPNRKLISCALGLTPQVNVGTITLEDCIVRNYTNSVIELVENLGAKKDSRVRIEEIKINNCIVFDMGRNRNNYPSLISITNKNDKNGYCRRYNISNSTFYRFARGLLEARVFTTIDGYANPDIRFTNCTIDRMGYKHIADGEWWGTNTEAVKNVFDCKATDVATDITVALTGCIFGELRTDILSEKFVQGVNTNAITTYMLASSKAVISSGTTLLESIPATASDLFPNRDRGDYSIAVEGAWQNVGDPRWRK